MIKEHGNLLKFKQECDAKGSNLLPEGKNGIYKGGNLLMLCFLQMRRGYSLNRWLTFNHIRTLDGQVKKGSKSAEVYF